MVFMLHDFKSVPVFRHEAAGFTSHDSLATINSVTRLNKVHLHYGSYFRSSYTLHNSLPPYAVKLLDSRTGIRETTGLSPAGFLFIYTRLVAYHSFYYNRKLTPAFKLPTKVCLFSNSTNICVSKIRDIDN